MGRPTGQGEISETPYDNQTPSYDQADTGDVAPAASYYDPTQQDQSVNTPPPPAADQLPPAQQQSYTNRAAPMQNQYQHPAQYQPPPPGPVQFPPRSPQMNPTGPQQPAAYPPQQPAAYPPQHPAAYPPQQQQPAAYPPQQPAAYPPQQNPPPPEAYPPQKPVAYPPSSQGQYQQHPPQVNVQPVQYPPAGQGQGGYMPPLSPIKPTAQGIPIQMAVPNSEGWRTGLFDCMEDPTNAIITVLFPCLTFGQIAELIDNGQTTCMTGAIMYALVQSFIGMPCIYSCTYRTKLRAKYGLVEAPAPDWITHFICEPCALCQAYRELNLRGLDPSIGWQGNLARNQQQQQMTMMAPQQQRMM